MNKLDEGFSFKTNKQYMLHKTFITFVSLIDADVNLWLAKNPTATIHHYSITTQGDRVIVGILYT